MFQFHVRCSRNVRYEFRIRSLDRKDRDEGMHFFVEIAGNAYRGHLFEPARECDAWVGIQKYPGRLPCSKIGKIGLIDTRPDSHARRVHNLQNGRSRINFFSFQYFSHLLPAVIPYGTQHGEPILRSSDTHLFSVALSVEHGVSGAVALNFQKAELGLGSHTLEVKGFLQLFPTRDGFFQIKLILLSINPRGHLVLKHFQLRGFYGIFGLLQLSFVFGARRSLVRPFFLNLFFQVAILSVTVQGILDLSLPIELHQEIASLYHHPGVNQLGNNQCPGPRSGLSWASQARYCHGIGLYRFHDAMKAECADEVAATGRRRGKWIACEWFSFTSSPDHSDPQRHSQHPHHAQRYQHMGHSPRSGRGRWSWPWFLR